MDCGGTYRRRTIVPLMHNHRHTPCPSAPFIPTPCRSSIHGLNREHADGQTLVEGIQYWLEPRAQPLCNTRPKAYRRLIATFDGKQKIPVIPVGETHERQVLVIVYCISLWKLASLHLPTRCSRPVPKDKHGVTRVLLVFKFCVGFSLQWFLYMRSTNRFHIVGARISMPHCTAVRPI